MQIIALYHFFHPDDVISARLYSDLAEEFANDDSDPSRSVVAMPAVHSCHDERQVLPKYEQWNKVEIRRVWRPNFKQSSNMGRVLNALFIWIGWTWRAIFFRRHSNEVVIIGTDPILSVLVAIPWRILRPKSKIVHWCHDLYPDAAIADGILSDRSWISWFLKWLTKLAYFRCNRIVDLGPCMRERIQRLVGDQESTSPKTNSDTNSISNNEGRYATLTPWSLVEPPVVQLPELATRATLFGDAPLGLLYSGNLGRAHEFDNFLKLATRVSTSRIAFCFAGRGPRYNELVEASDGISNIRFAGFAEESQLQTRLIAADIHLVSLREEWTGTVVPSKFFGAIASGRPVIFAGSGKSALAHWIREYRLGWILNASSLDQVACELVELAENPDGLSELKLHCHQIYADLFSKETQLQAWKNLLASIS